MSDLESTFDALAARAPELALTTAQERVAKIRRLLQAVLGARQAFYDAAAKELAINETDVVGQLLMVKLEAEFTTKHLAEWMRPARVRNSLMMLGQKAYIRYEPKGVVLNLATWNAPIAISLVPAISAIAAGNAVLLKPSELAPYSATILHEVVRATFPENEFVVVEGGPEVAQELLKQPFNHICFIGGQRIGREVMKAAAENFASVTLEMGGKNPAFVDASADLEDAAQKIAWGRLSNAGQVCVAPDYILVDERVRDRFVETLVRAMRKMYDPAGTGFENSPDFPRIVNDRHFERILGLIDDAVAKGARVVLGGNSDKATRFIAPTILTGVNDDMRIMQEEVFGPVICIVGYRTPEEALANVHRRPKPLALYIYAQDGAMVERLIARTSSGSTVVNHNLIQSGTNPYLPFGGANHSGMGRVGGERGFREFSNARSVVEEQPAARGLTPLPPFTDKHRKMMASMLDRDVVVPDAMVTAIETVLKLRALFRPRRVSGASPSPSP